MFKTLQATFPKDQDYPERTYRLSILTRVLNGTIYDGLKHAFHEEENGAGEYVKLRERRPAVRYGLCKMVVDDSVALLFSEGHFPEIDCGKDAGAREALQKIVKETTLNAVMIDAATRGSVGSVAIMMRVLNKRVFFDVMETAYLTPTWKATAPDELEKVTERYKTKGSALREAGYTVADDDLNEDFWYQREWNAIAETHFEPWKVAAENAVPAVDPSRTVTHNLRFVPVRWVRNLPGGDSADGGCTFPDEAIDTGIEIDYQLSQVGRGLKYSSDPTLLIKEPATGDETIVRSASNAISVGKEGDAKLLEINGTAAGVVMDYVRMLREFALENMHGNRANADKISAAQSGRAMELMNQALIWLADKLRISYGEGALLDLLKMVALASQKIALTFKDGSAVGEIKAEIALRWPAWYQPTASDQQNTATTLQTLVNAGIISRKTAIKVIAAQYDIEDVEAEYALAQAEQEAREANAQKQVKINE